MKVKVFLADDHAVVRDGLRLLLNSQSDIEVVGDASNGRDALQEVVALGPDVAIIDIAMPELNGIEVTYRLNRQLPEIRVIILSMHSTAEHVYRALEAGARGYLIKESAGSEVVEAVRVVQGGRRYLSQKISDIVVEGYINQHNTPEMQSPLSRLSPREREILQLVVEGNSSAEIADMLSLSPKTIDTYRSRLMQKLEINDLPGLVKFAIQHGLTSLD